MLKNLKAERVNTNKQAVFGSLVIHGCCWDCLPTCNKAIDDSDSRCEILLIYRMLVFYQTSWQQVCVAGFQKWLNSPRNVTWDLPLTKDLPAPCRALNYNCLGGGQFKCCCAGQLPGVWVWVGGVLVYLYVCVFVFVYMFLRVGLCMCVCVCVFVCVRVCFDQQLPMGFSGYCGRPRLWAFSRTTNMAADDVSHFALIGRRSIQLRPKAQVWSELFVNAPLEI